MTMMLLLLCLAMIIAMAHESRGASFALNLQHNSRSNNSNNIAPPISISTLLATNLRPTSTVSDAWLGRPTNAEPATNVFNGRLTLSDTSNIRYSVLVDTYGYIQYASRQRLPTNFTVEFTQENDRIVPVFPGLMLTGDIVYNLVFTTGYVWNEGGGVDDGYSRASIPFALSERNANCVLNGLMLFGYKTTGEVTQVRFQITQETCKYFKVDYWGQLPARMTTANRDEDRFVKARDRYDMEMTNRMRTKPISQLDTDYPGVRSSTFGATLTEEHISALGVVVDGTHYIKPCSTRTGDYGGMCEELLLPSYSTSKGIFAGLALMRLGQLFGESVYDELIRTWLPSETREARGSWEAVTFRQALDMKTGNYLSAEYQQDEDFNMGDFFAAETYSDKIKAAFDYPSNVEPGAKHIYHTTDIMIATTAMQNYLQAQRGTVTDIWELIVEDILKPLRVNSVSMSTLRTYDNDAIPYGGYGCFFLADDIAKITSFVLNNQGKINGAQVLDSYALATGLQKNPLDRGISADKPTENLRYSFGVWAKVYPASVFDCIYYQPYFSGFGGLRFVMMANGAVYYYVSDNGEFEIDNEVKEGEKFGPLCL